MDLQGLDSQSRGRYAWPVIGALEILKRERDDAAEQIRSLRGRIRDLEAAISVLEGHPVPDKNIRSAGDLKQHVINHLGQIGDNGGTPKEIADALTQNGRVTSDASVSSTLSRLKNESRVTNRNGRWFVANETADNAGWSRNDSPRKEWYDSDEDPPF